MKEQNDEVERLKGLLALLTELPSFCVSCSMELHGPSAVVWDGETLRCPRCGVDADGIFGDKRTPSGPFQVQDDIVLVRASNGNSGFVDITLQRDGLEIERHINISLGRGDLHGAQCKGCDDCKSPDDYTCCERPACVSPHRVPRLQPQKKHVGNRWTIRHQRLYNSLRYKASFHFTIGQATSSNKAKVLKEHSARYYSMATAISEAFGQWKR